MPNDSEHALFQENVPAYALGILDPEEAVRLEAHLQTCTACQAELASFKEVGSRLLMAQPPQAPSAALRKRLMTHLPSARTVRKPRWQWSFDRIALAAAIALLLILNLFSLSQTQSMQRQQAQLTREIQTGQVALAMLAYPGTQSLPINQNGITGSMLLDKDRNVVVLVVWNLPPLKSDQTYQLWFIDRQDQRTSAAIFTPAADLPFTTVSIIAPQSLSNFSGLGLTVEPAGGSTQPTGARLFKIDF